MYSIGDLARITGVKVPTIRYYEQSELLAAPARSSGNQRRYTDEELQRLSFIRHSRELGFSIDDIRELLDLSVHPEKPCGDAHGIAVRHLADIQMKIAKLKRLESELKRISKCDAENVAECAVIEALADHRLCSTEH